MKILAIDASGMTASAAVAEDGRLTAEYSVNFKKTHSQTLLPMIDEITKMVQLDLNTIDAVAVAAGPGSFTGLRIGSATAKGIGLALDKPIVAVPTLEGMAYNGWGFDGLICPLLDARRNRVYAGLYHFEDGEIKTVMDQTALEVPKLIGRLNEAGEKVLLMGDGADAYRDELISSLAVEALFAPIHMNHQRAGAVAVCAMKYYREGKIQTAAQHVPEYLSLSQAERERARKLRGEKKAQNEDSSK